MFVFVEDADAVRVFQVVHLAVKRDLLRLLHQRFHQINAAAVERAHFLADGRLAHRHFFRRQRLQDADGIRFGQFGGSGGGIRRQIIGNGRRRLVKQHLLNGFLRESHAVERQQSDNGGDAVPYKRSHEQFLKMKLRG